MNGSTLFNLAQATACVIALGAVNVATNTVKASELTVIVENVQPADGFFFTPLWVGVHDGAFDVYSSGQSAASFPGLEEIAEEGDTAPLSTSFNGSGVDATITSPGGFGGAPVFDPGEKVSFALNVSDPATTRYFSYAAMVIPSNDAFFANGDPLAHMVFDGFGNFTGPFTIDIFGSDILDAGTEVNDVNGGAAFSANGGLSADENGLIAAHPGLDEFLGTDTAASTTIGSPLTDDTLLARITVVPEPSSLGLLTIGATLILMVLRRRRSRRM